MRYCPWNGGNGPKQFEVYSQVGPLSDAAPLSGTMFRREFMMREFETHPGFEHDVRSSFERQNLMKLYGADITRIVPGAVDIQMPFRADLTQHHGYLHAAVVTALVDNACGFAAMTISPAGAEILTVEYKVNFLAPAMGETLIAHGSVKKAGRTFIVCTGEAVMVHEGQQRHVATMLATMFPVQPRTSQ
jgi:uncharacterized protein (TIGR00369 family)